MIWPLIINLNNNIASSNSWKFSHIIDSKFSLRIKFSHGFRDRAIVNKFRKEESVWQSLFHKFFQ